MARTGCPGGPFMMIQVVLGTTCVGGPINSLQPFSSPSKGLGTRQSG